MMRVRLPDGTQVVFNTAGYINRFDKYSDIYEKQGGKWLAQVPNTWMIENVEPCKVVRADGRSAIDATLRMIRDRNTAGQEFLISEIKRELQAWSTRRYAWK